MADKGFLIAADVFGDVRANGCTGEIGGWVGDVADRA